MATPNHQESTTTLIGDIVAKIEASKEWKILVYGINEPEQPEANEAHMRLLNGILGTNISLEKRTTSSFCYEKNGVSIKIYIGSHAECNVSYSEIDLMLYFIPVNVDMVDNSHMVKIEKITTARGAVIWKHAVITFTHVDATIESFIGKSGDIAVRLEGVLDSWTRTVQSSLTKAIANESSVNPKDVLIRIAGRQDKIDLPKPHEKWFSHLWIGCFLSTKIDAMPAILKISQHRITNSIRKQDAELLQLFKQQIQAKENSIQLPKNLQIGLGLGGSTAIAGAAATGATVGALIGALAIGIPSFGVAAGTGLALGAVIGGGMGAGIAGAAVGGSYKVAKDKQMVEIDTSDLKLYYGEILSRIPKITNYLIAWAEKKVNCKIVVTGVKGEGVTTVAAALAQKQPLSGGSGLYMHQVIPMKANVIVYDSQGFPKIGDKQLKARELVRLQNEKSTHLLVFCIPMNSSKEDFVYSPHAKYLERLCEVDEKILSNTVIALTHANEMRAEMIKRNDLSQTSFNEFFNTELQDWKQQIATVLKRYIHIDSDITENVPIIPVGNETVTIDLSDEESGSSATQYCWLSEMFLRALPVTKPEGVPALIEYNQQRIRNRLCSNPDDAKELIIKAKCLMFSKAGSQEKKQPGEAIGMILGVREPE